MSNTNTPAFPQVATNFSRMGDKLVYAKERK